MSQDKAPVWFITGCSTGFGREIARQVLGRGWRAVVTARNPEQVRDIVAGHEDNALALPLDVNDKDAVARAVQAAEAPSTPERRTSSLYECSLDADASIPNTA